MHKDLSDQITLTIASLENDKRDKTNHLSSAQLKTIEQNRHKMDRNIYDKIVNKQGAKEQKFHYLQTDADGNMYEGFFNEENQKDGLGF